MKSRRAVDLAQRLSQRERARASAIRRVIRRKASSPRGYRLSIRKDSQFPVSRSLDWARQATEHVKSGPGFSGAWR
jgi:hypothetical protein